MNRGSTAEAQRTQRNAGRARGFPPIPQRSARTVSVSQVEMISSPVPAQERENKKSALAERRSRNTPVGWFQNTLVPKLQLGNPHSEAPASIDYREQKMPRSRYRVAHDQCPHFLTATINNWLPIFTRPETRDIVLDS